MQCKTKFIEHNGLYLVRDELEKFGNDLIIKTELRHIPFFWNKYYYEL